ncbi:uncharacterized protein [Elaeis guineensis]|uniref:Uncharacterized protein LOC105032652 n=1 Tax=Elaeis guineensis var. tenera TaxID=51953 RepID=A0A6I9QA09_ELAGV|nr:uncharacterized protein LOC105032652 [Elaeis guineensis]XP_019701941.1 uncharacterized protein LOC105032652 [Elaeis guineensis]
MANHDLILGPSPDLALGNGHRLVLGQSHGLGVGHGHGLGLGHSPDHELGHGHAHNLGLGHHHDSRLFLGYHHPHDEDHGHGHSSDLVLGKNHDPDPGNLAAQNHELELSDDHEMALVATHGGLDGNQGFEQLAIDQSPELALPPSHDMLQAPLAATSILQTRKLVVSPEHQLTVGQDFPDVKSCRRALRDAAIACHFEIQTVKSDKTRFTARCASEGCPWRVHAAKLPGVPTFTIRTINDVHSCSGITHLGHQQASVQWVANSVEERLRENPHYKPKEILEDIHRVHGITLSYKQAWRGKERIMAAVRGSFEEGYRLLPQYCEQVKRTNPGSIASVYRNDIDNCFKHLFISYYASIYGFVNACRPLIGLDRAVLKSKYLGTLLLATGFDGDGAIFPLAFAVVDEENDDNWIWFLSELHNLLETHTENMPRLTILSDRQKGIVDGVDLNFPTAFHGFCMRHLTDSFRKEFSNTMLVNHFWEAAQALTPFEFEAKMMEIEALSQEAAYWIRNIPPRLWATSSFEGSRYGQLTANIVESLNNWIPETSGLSIIQIMECIRRQLMTWFNERREMSMQWTTTLVPSAERRLLDAVEHAQSYQVVRSDEAEFNVISPHEGAVIVDIRNRCCMCRGWQLYSLPCVHGVAALHSCRQNVSRFAENYFTVATYRKTYSQTIHPIPDKSLWKELSEGVQNGGDRIEIVINPPKSLRPPGRPRKKRVRAEDRGRVKRVVHCSRCNQTGHFRTTCAAPI